MKFESAFKWTANVALVGLAIYAIGRQIQRSEELHQKAMEALDTPDDGWVIKSTFNTVTWADVEADIIQLLDDGHTQMGNGDFVSWDHTLRMYLASNDPTDQARTVLQLYVDLLVEEDKAIAARILDRFKRSPDFTDYHVTAAADLMEGVVDAKEATP